MKRILITIFFLALIATGVVLSRRNSTAPAPAEAAGAKPALERYGFTLTDAAQEAGLIFTHRSPKLDPKLDHIMPLIASMGAAVSIVDFDKDGWLDIYVCNSGEGSQNALFRNLGNGKFEDVAARMGVADVNRMPDGVSTGAVWGDYDNDGYEDLLLYKWGKPELFHNDGGKGFTRVTDQAGLPAWINANTALWFDFDNDGHLDMLICGYYREDINLWNLQDTRIMPDSFEYAQNGGRKYLLRNLGNGKFEDVTEAMGFKSNRWALAAVAADLRGTGYPDVFIANDYGISEVFANQNGKGFQEIGKEALYWHIGVGPKSGMNAAVGDVLNNGQLAIHVSNITAPGNLVQANNLWLPKAGTSGNKIQYDNVANAFGVEDGGWSFGAQFGDLNNDGNLDLYLTNGNVSQNQNKSYWYDFSKITGSNKSIISDARNWPAIQDRSLSGHEQKCLWINDGAGRFTNIAPIVGVKDTYDGRSVALGDFGNRGALDIVVANQNAPLVFYRNTVVPENQWIAFELEGTRSNRSAIGAQARLFWNGKQQLQEVSGGSGFCAQNMRRLHFGLGKNPQVEKLVIRWPSGQTQTISNPQVGIIHKIKEPA